MDRYPAIVWVGAAVLGKVAAEMVLTDPIVVTFVELPKGALWAAEAAGAAGVLVAGRLWLRWSAARAERAAAAGADACRTPGDNGG